MITCFDVVGCCYWCVRTIASRARGDFSRHFKHKTSQTIQESIHYVPSVAQMSSNCAQLFIDEDNGRVIEVRRMGARPHTRLVSRTHRVNLDWLIERINLSSNASRKDVHTKKQIADIPTKGSFTCDEWYELMTLSGAVSECFHRSPFSVVAALVAAAQQMAKRTYSID